MLPEEQNNEESTPEAGDNRIKFAINETSQEKTVGAIPRAASATKQTDDSSSEKEDAQLSVETIDKESAALPEE